MRVLLVFSSSQLGGAERSLSRMAFASKDVEYQFATLSNEGPWCDWIRSKGIVPYVFGQGPTCFALLTACRKLVCHLRQHPVNIVYVCGSRASVVLRFTRVFMPNVKLVSGIRWNPDSRSGLDRFFRIAERFSHRLVDGWITNSNVAQQTLVKRCHIPEKKIAVIHNGLDFLHYSVVPLSKRPMEVLTVANLNPRKGHLEYLHVIQTVIKEVPETRFIFVGRDDMNGEVQRTIDAYGLSSHIRYEGFQDDVTPWYRRCRVFVLPSLWNEGCPTAILEAMSFSVPCVAFEMDGISELITSGIHGELLQRGDHKGMAEVILKLIRDTSLSSKLGQNGRLRIQTAFAIETTAQKHSEYFQNLCNSSR